MKHMAITTAWRKLAACRSALESACPRTIHAHVHVTHLPHNSPPPTPPHPPHPPIETHPLNPTAGGGGLQVLSSRAVVKGCQLNDNRSGYGGGLEVAKQEGLEGLLTEVTVEVGGGGTARL
jgi:hypothetical protein